MKTFRSDFKRGKITPERKLKMNRQKRQSMMKSREVKQIDGRDVKMDRWQAREFGER